VKNLREATHLLHRTTPPGHGLAEADLLRVIEWLEHVVTDLDRLHRERRWHGAVGRIWSASGAVEPGSPRPGARGRRRSSSTPSGSGCA
jgi:hypothetical protein